MAGVGRRSAAEVAESFLDHPQPTLLLVCVNGGAMASGAPRVAALALRVLAPLLGSGLWFAAGDISGVAVHGSVGRAEEWMGAPMAASMLKGGGRELELSMEELLRRGGNGGMDKPALAAACAELPCGKACSRLLMVSTFHDNGFAMAGLDLYAGAENLAAAQWLRKMSAVALELPGSIGEGISEFENRQGKPLARSADSAPAEEFFETLAALALRREIAASAGPGGAGRGRPARV